MKQENDCPNRGARFRGGPVPRRGVATLLALAALLLAHAAPISAQQHRVSGRVTEAAGGAPLAGVQVVVRGTAARTVTDASGNYTLAAPSPTGTLVFSRIGYANQEAAIGGRNTINVSLAAQAQQLEEIVAIGYGTKSEVKLTESIATVSAEEIERAPVASVDQAIQGRIPGVQITSVSGQPGAPVQVRIRGVGTVGNTQPLWVIDGVPVGRGTGITNPLATINPNDVESVSVLKDASAAAVYGVQAANGVVLVTTKRGKLGKPTINYDGYIGMQRTPELWAVNNSEQYIALRKEAIANYNAQTGAKLTLDPALLDPALAQRNINWVDAAVNQDAPIQNHNVSVSGATEQINYYVSGGYYQQDATIRKWDLDRLSFRANTDFRINDRFRFGETFSLSHQEVYRGANAGGDGFLLASSARTPPFFQIYDTDKVVPNNRYGFSGNAGVGGIFGIPNLIGQNEITDVFDRTTRVLGSLYGELDILSGLTFRSQGSADLGFIRNDRWRPGFTAAELGIDRTPHEFGDSRAENSSIVWLNTLNLVRSVGEHDFNILGGVEVQQNRYTQVDANNTGFLTTSPYYYRVAKTGTSPSLGGGVGESAYLGYLGRLSYDYADRYLLTASIRRDGSWRFAPGRRWGTFPSVSAGWRISEEPFFNVPAISELKVRGSWGQLGNDQTSAYPYISRVSTTPDYSLDGKTTIAAPVPFNFVSPDVTWETVESADVGVEGALLNNAVDFGVTYYRRTTRDFLISVPIPAIAGLEGGAPLNVGSVLNSGWEFELGYNTVAFRDLNLSISGNLTTVKNELTAILPEVSEFTSSFAYRTAVGFPIGYLYGYRTCGIYQNAAAAAAATPDKTIGNNKAQAGDVCFQDVNGPAPKDAPPGTLFSGEPDGQITTADRVFLGKTIPDFYYGINLNANWRAFDVGVFFQGVQGVSLYNALRRDAENLGSDDRNQLATTQNRWTPENPSSTMPRAVANDPNQNNRFSDRWVEDGSYLRLKNFQVGFRVPNNLAGSNLTNARIYVAATNLLTFTRYTGLDPEVVTFSDFGRGAGASQLEAGTDQGNIPQPRVFQVGVSVGF